MKEKPTVGFRFSGCVLLTLSLRRRRMSIYISLFTVLPHASIPVNYTSEFREFFEATKGVFQYYTQIGYLILH